MKFSLCIWHLRFVNNANTFFAINLDHKWFVLSNMFQISIFIISWQLAQKLNIIIAITSKVINSEITNLESSDIVEKVCALTWFYLIIL